MGQVKSKLMSPSKFMRTRIMVKSKLRETITEIGMSTENAKIECPAKLVTRAFIYFNDNNERNKYVRSGNMLRKELRGRKIKISRSMDAEERFHHGTPLNSISLNWLSKYGSVNGQVRTCQSGSLKYQVPTH